MDLPRLLQDPVDEGSGTPLPPLRVHRELSGAMRKRAAMQPRESEIQRAIMDYLAARGFRVFRRNVMGVMPMRRGGAVWVGIRGQADLFGWHIGTGRALEVEVKRPGNPLSPFQRAWLFNAEADKVIAFMASSVEDCELALQTYGI